MSSHPYTASKEGKNSCVRPRALSWRSQKSDGRHRNAQGAPRSLQLHEGDIYMSIGAWMTEWGTCTDDKLKKETHGRPVAETSPL